MRTELRALLHSSGTRDGIFLGVSMIVAGALDYAVNILAGRWLEPVEYGIFVSVTAILQVLLLLTIAVRTMVGFCTAKLSVQSNPLHGVGIFVQRAWHRAWQWGLMGTALMLAASPVLARLLRLPNSWPVWAASLMVVLLFLREVAYGALQGTEAFLGLGVIQVTQAFLRMVFAAGLIWLGGKAVGVIFAQSLANAVCVVLALWWLRPLFRKFHGIVEHSISWHQWAQTLLALGALGVLTNLDALFVKHFFSPRVAGDYGPVVTLAKVSLFVPWTIGIILLPKVVRRQATGRDPRPILCLGLIAALFPGLILTGVYFLFPGTLVRVIFTGEYSDPGVVLALASLASSLYAGLNIWTNYALSLERSAFIYSLVAVLAWQGVGMILLGRDSLVHMALVMVSAGLMGNVLGFVTTWISVPAPIAMREETAR
jgi:O-antigen/teichoic acid export membrane protein